MPTRFIKESCRSSKNLNLLSDFEERLFWRLITTADDFGRFMACPELVRASCFPFKPLSTKSISSAIQSLQTHHLITLYRVDDRQYGYFHTWERHQGKPRAKSSKFPSPADAQQNHMLADAMHVHANVTGHSDTDTDTKAHLNSLTLDLKGKVRSISTPFPEDFKPDERAVAMATAFKFNAHILFTAFRDHHLARGTLFKDWQAAFRTWIRNEKKFKEAKA